MRVVGAVAVLTLRMQLSVWFSSVSDGCMAYETLKYHCNMFSFHHRCGTEKWKWNVKCYLDQSLQQVPAHLFLISIHILLLHQYTISVKEIWVRPPEIRVVTCRWASQLNMCSQATTVYSYIRQRGNFFLFCGCFRILDLTMNGYKSSCRSLRF